ncbi:ATP-grasp domain-containing protein [Methanogenium organophilum]|uniref:ATP-grasp domain-containing protein n=1 Tax=Methanogenium organophilum TaxID=2199 RepID=A0A9X9T783_METOG|nr:ATP-grasp domain-containing protein [Methanogenium organophilum]WAI00445.1 ATP-grasp domain-containing protein [Methanogenium organophilum]
MIILEEPYVSPYLRETIIATGLPVLRTPIAEAQDFPPETVMLDDAAMVARMTKTPDQKLYSTSEHAIQWIAENLQDTGLPETIALFKDKAAFRRLIRPLYPDFFFREVAADDLKILDVSRIPKPFIIKPSVGFFSAGVHMVASDAEWKTVLATVQDEMNELSSLFPPQVCRAATWIIEEYVSGTEIAVDAFYTAAGEPVVLDILSHLFASDADVDDKVYLTSKAIVREYLAPVTELLHNIQEQAGIRNFPLHIELRVTDDGTAVPIELNPMRFAGWCTTDIAAYAHGINVYRAYFEEDVPDWDALSCADDGDIYALLIAKPPADIPPETIRGFDYDGFFASFSHPLEMRPIDFTRYPVFGFCYVRLAGGDLTEVERFMKDDLRRFIHLQ